MTLTSAPGYINAIMGVASGVLDATEAIAALRAENKGVCFGDEGFLADVAAAREAIAANALVATRADLEADYLSALSEYNALRSGQSATLHTAAVTLGEAREQLALCNHAANRLQQAVKDRPFLLLSSTVDWQGDALAAPGAMDAAFATVSTTDDDTPPPQYARIRMSPASITQSPGRWIAVDVLYKNAATSVGLGLYVHYDSSILTWAQPTDILDQSYMGTGTPGMFPSDDLDPVTDATMVSYWMNLMGTWPEAVLTAPGNEVKLYTLHFRVNPAATTTSTKINFTFSTPSATYFHLTEDTQRQLVVTIGEPAPAVADTTITAVPSVFEVQFDANGNLPNSGAIAFDLLYASENPHNGLTVDLRHPYLLQRQAPTNLLAASTADPADAIGYASDVWHDDTTYSTTDYAAVMADPVFWRWRMQWLNYSDAWPAGIETAEDNTVRLATINYKLNQDFITPGAYFITLAYTTDSDVLLTSAIDGVHPDIAVETAPEGSLPVSEVETLRVFTTGVTSGTFTLTFNGYTTAGLNYNANAATIQTALVALPGIGSGDLTATSPTTGAFTLTFGGALANTTIVPIVPRAYWVRTGVISVTTTYGRGGQDEEDAVWVTNANSGTFTLTFGGQETQGIPWNANAATLKAELEALSTIGSGNIEITTYTPIANYFFVKFVGVFSQKPQELLQLACNALTWTPEVVVSETTAGGASVNEVQTITFTRQLVDGGTWAIAWGGETTTELAWNATAATVQSALTSLTSIGSGNVLVGGTQAPAPLTVTFQGTLGNANQAPVVVSSNLTFSGLTTGVNIWRVAAGDTGKNTTQNIATTAAPVSGTYTLSFRNVTTGALAWSATASEVTTALEGLSNIGTGNVSVSGSWSSGYSVTFINRLGLQGIYSPIACNYSTLRFSDPAPTVVSTVNGDEGEDCTQTLSVGPDVTGGTWSITFSGQTTTALAYSATAATIQTALQTLSGVGAGNVEATGGPINQAPVAVTFTGALGKSPQPELVTHSALLGDATTQRILVRVLAADSPAPGGG